MRLPSVFRQLRLPTSAPRPWSELPLLLYNHVRLEFPPRRMLDLRPRQSKKLYAWETGGVDDVAMLLLCGEIDTKVSLRILPLRTNISDDRVTQLIAESVALDRKVRFRVGGKTNLAVKYLRDQLSSILAAVMRGRALTDAQMRWYELAMLLMGRRKAVQEDAVETVTIIHRNA